MQEFLRDQAPSKHFVVQGVFDRTCRYVPTGIQEVGVVNCQIDDRGGLNRLGFRLAVLLGLALSFALDSALHGAVERLRPIWRFGMFTPGCQGNCNDLILAQPQLFAPALDMQPWGPALPPSGQCSGIEAQRVQQHCEKPIKIGIARLRILLLLYRST